jgi:hypothetical protein
MTVMSFISCTSCPACGLEDPMRVSTAGARYYTIFAEFHQLDDKETTPPSWGVGE